MCWLALILGLTGGLFAGIRIGALFCELTHGQGPGPDRARDEVARLTAELEEARRGPGGVLAEVAAERARQIGKGYTAEHDDGAVMGELAQVAGLVLLRLNSHKVTLHEADEVAGYILGKYSDDRYRQLIIALAMGAAEAERLIRLRP